MVIKLPSFKDTSGFTLVELLVVIGILGIIIAALLVVVDPVQQLAKARDIGYKKTASDFIGAVTAYQLQKGKFPWENAAACATDLGYPAGGGVFATGKKLSDVSNCVTELKTASEVRTGFASNTNTLLKLYVNGDSNAGVSSLCYFPDAAVNRTVGQGAIYKSDGTDATITTGVCKITNDNDCYYCVK